MGKWLVRDGPAPEGEEAGVQLHEVGWVHGIMQGSCCGDLGC